MPELPEVETIVRGLTRTIKGKSIKKILVLDRLIVRGITGSQLGKKLINRRIEEIKRVSKNVLIGVSGGLTIRIHLRMTGSLIFFPKKSTERGGKNGDDAVSKYARVIFYFSQGSRLEFCDVRRFARLDLIPFPIGDVLMNPENYNLGLTGPDPLASNFSEIIFKEAIRKRGGAIKTVLMDQKVVAGIGNIYASEILFRAGIHPSRRASKLKKQEIALLYKALREVICEAVRFRGTSVSDFRDILGKKGGYQKKLSVYGRTGKPCPVCGNMIEKISLSQRSTFFCALCQKG